MNGVSVMIGMPAGRDLPVLTVKSLIGTSSALQSRGIECRFGFIANSAVIQWARDEVIDTFLESDCKVLFWIDSDMVWEPGQFIRLLVFSQMFDVICAAYPAKIETPTFYMNWDKGPPNEYGLLEIKGLGLGFTVMRREVVEALVAKAPKIVDQVSNRTIASVFRVDRINDYRRGEDMAFFQDIRDAGYKVWLDPSIDLGHVGSRVYRGSIRDALGLDGGH